MAIHSLIMGIEGSGINRTKTVDNAQVGVALLDGEAVADSTTNFEVGFELDVSAVKSFYLNSSQDVLLDTNVITPNPGVDGNVISLLADIPYVWHVNSYDSFLLTLDVTVLYFTNTSGAVATIDCVALYDASP